MPLDIKEALDYLHTIPAGNWNMATYRACGSIGCALGHLAQHPKGKYGRLEKRIGKLYAYEVIVFNGDTYYASDYMLLGAMMFDLPLQQSTWLFGPADGTKNQKGVFFERAAKMGL